MKTLLGIPLGRQLPDAEFVERLRRNLRLQKRLAWVYLGVSLIATGPLLQLLQQLGRLAAFPDNTPEVSGMMFWTGVVMGMAFSMAFGSLLLVVVMGVLVGFNLFGFNRSALLLITYHDALTRRQAPAAGPAQARPAEAGGEPADTSRAALSRNPRPAAQPERFRENGGSGGYGRWGRASGS